MWSLESKVFKEVNCYHYAEFYAVPVTVQVVIPGTFIFSKFRKHLHRSIEQDSVLRIRVGKVSDHGFGSTSITALDP